MKLGYVNSNGDYFEYEIGENLISVPLRPDEFHVWDFQLNAWKAVNENYFTPTVLKEDVRREALHRKMFAVNTLATDGVVVTNEDELNDRISYFLPLVQIISEEMSSGGMTPEMIALKQSYLNKIRLGRNFLLSVEKASNDLCKINPIPLDYTDNKYWPSLT